VTPKRILLIAGYGLAIASLIWLLHDFHIMQELRRMAAADWRWVLLGMVFDVLSYAVQGVRWKLLLSPFGKVRLTSAIRAVYAALFANLVLPLRPGEFLRAYLLSDSEGITMGRVLGSVGVERLIDLVIATAALGVASLFVDLPRRFQRVAYILGIVTLVLLAGVVILIFYLETKLSSNPDLGQDRPGFTGRFMSALSALHAMSTAPSFYTAVLASLAMPLCQVMALWGMMRSYGLPLSFSAAVVVLLIINLGVSLPNAPANVGSYQIFCVLGLSVFQIDKTTATGFSFFAFIALTLPFVFLGFAALLRSGLSLRGMSQQVKTMRRESFPSPARSSSAAL
jgi:glycosyltransferase 2 family protein